MNGPSADTFSMAVAVSKYKDSGWEQPLKRAQRNADRLVSFLRQEGYDTDLVRSPSHGKLAKILQRKEAEANGAKRAVLVWTGHAAVLEGALNLAVRDTPAGPGMRPLSYRAGDLSTFLANLGSTDSLLIIDSCSAGAADAEVFLDNLRRLESSSHAGRAPTLACVVSCKGYEKAGDGAFLEELVDLLTEGPVDVEPGPNDQLWSPNYERVSIDLVFGAINRKRNRRGPHPRTTITGSSDITFANPRFDPGAVLVDDGARRGRGEDPLVVGLVGTPATAYLLQRLLRGPGLLVVTGSPGKGKSSCLAYVRNRAPAATMVVQAESGTEILTAVAAAVAPHVAIALDGLDEARAGEHERLVDLAIAWARTRCVVVASRTGTARSQSARAAAARLIAAAEKEIDLDEKRWSGDAIERYAAERLRGGDDGP
jgi:hypothetical protein